MTVARPMPLEAPVTTATGVVDIPGSYPSDPTDTRLPGVTASVRGYRARMTTNVRVVDAPVTKVWDVLADGWLYPLWVVGTSRVRDVDPSFPEVGSRIYHSVGLWPLLIDDYTEVLESVPQTMLVLRARGWPIGEAAVRLTLEAEGDRTRVRIDEDAVAGPGTLFPHPLRGMTIKQRNTEGLRRLALIAERR